MKNLLVVTAWLLVPVYVAVYTKKLPKMKTMLCAGLAVAGVGFLSLAQSHLEGGGLGILLVSFAAMTYAACILATEKVSREADPVTIGIIQLGTMGILSLAASLLLGEFSFPQTGKQWFMMLTLVLLCSCFGFAFQPVGQKYVPAETAAVFTVVNPLTASLMGITLAGESISASKLIGYSLILIALILYNSKRDRRMGEYEKNQQNE